MSADSGLPIAGGTVVISHLVPSGGGLFATHDAVYGRGGYRAVADLVERDCIPGTNRAKAGMRVRVLTLPYIYQLRDDLTTWDIVEVVGDVNAIVEATTAITGVVRYVDTVSGDDEADGLTPATAWATLQRFWDFIPDVKELDGFWECRVAGADTTPVVFPTDMTKENARDTGTFVTIQPLVEGVTPAESFTLGVGSAPANPDGGNKTATFEYSVGAYTTVPTDGDHWGGRKFTFGGKDFWFARCINAAASNPGGGLLRLVEIGPAGGTFDMFPTTAEIGANVGSGGSAEWDIRNRNPHVRIVPGGFKLATANAGRPFRSEGIQWEACDMSNASAVAGAREVYETNGGITGSVWLNTVTLRDGGRYHGGDRQGTIPGIFLGGIEILSGSWATQGAIVRGSAGGFGIVLGSTFGATTGADVAADIDLTDFESPGTHLDVRTGRARVANTAAGVSSEGATQAFRVSGPAASMDLVGGRWNGEFTSPNEVLDSARATGLAALAGGTPKLNNTSTPNDDLDIGGNASNPFQWSDMPKNDFASGDVSQGARAT